MLHPTKEEAIKIADMKAKGEKICCCQYFAYFCNNCLLYKLKSSGDEGGDCFDLTDAEELLGLAFIITMPDDIRKGLEELSAD